MMIKELELAIYCIRKRRRVHFGIFLFGLGEEGVIEPVSLGTFGVASLKPWLSANPSSHNEALIGLS